MGMLRNDTGWILDETERNTRRGLVVCYLGLRFMVD